MKILLADDEPIARTMLEHWLAGWGYQAICVKDGTSALEALRSDPEIRLAILDWVMPGLDGVDICREVRRGPQEPYVYIVLLTARNDKKDIVLGLDSGADDYLIKPCNPFELRVRLRAGKRVIQLEQQLIAAREELRVKAMRDALTGLLNRGATLEHAAKELGRSERTRQPMSLIVADLDHFKQVNDAHGHGVGDQVLAEAASRLGMGIRNYDSLGRIGGEEFLLVLPECTLSDAFAVATRVRASLVGRPISTEGGALQVSASFGVASTQQRPGATLAQLLKAADLAMYRAKHDGRDRVAVAAESDWRHSTPSAPTAATA